MFHISTLIYVVPAILISVTLHEMAHGYVSYKLGDPTPKLDGRLSLNPLRHLDFFGTLALLFAGFGWARPVRVDPSYYKEPKSGMVWTAFAGPGVRQLKIHKSSKSGLVAAFFVSSP